MQYEQIVHVLSSPASAFPNGADAAVRQAWADYLQASGRDGVFVYVSDHGDTCGEHGIFGKQTFYEGSAAIPLVFEGPGVRAGATPDDPVSIMDVGPTLCEMAGVEPPPAQDGRSLLPALGGDACPAGRAVLSEWMQEHDGRLLPGRMLRRDRWKLITFDGLEGADLLFDVQEDPDELSNLAETRPGTASRLREAAREGWEPERLRARHAEKKAHFRIIQEWGRSVEVDESEAWQVPAEFCDLPEIAE